jgi:hypothetical protein
MPRFNIGDKVRCYRRVWTIVPDNASLIGHTMTPEMAASRVKDGLEHLPNGRAVYLSDSDIAALQSALASEWDGDEPDHRFRVAAIIDRAEGRERETIASCPTCNAKFSVGTRLGVYRLTDIFTGLAAR